MFAIGSFKHSFCVQVRFLLPVLPVLNIAAASALARIWNNRGKRQWLSANATSFLLIAASAMAVLVMLMVSRQNYPGGHALHELHKWQASNSKHDQEALTVHIDVLSAMTGVSRFGQLDAPWTYSKVSITFQDCVACINLQ